MKVREAGRIVSVAVTIAVAVNTDGRREVLGMAMGASEAEAFWVEFLRKLRRRGLAGVKLVISFGRPTWRHQGPWAALTARGDQGGGRPRVPRQLAALPGGAVEKPEFS